MTNKRERALALPTGPNEPAPHVRFYAEGLGDCPVNRKPARANADPRRSGRKKRNHRLGHERVGNHAQRSCRRDGRHDVSPLSFAPPCPLRARRPLRRVIDGVDDGRNHPAMTSESISFERRVEGRCMLLLMSGKSVEYRWFGLRDLRAFQQSARRNLGIGQMIGRTGSSPLRTGYSRFPMLEVTYGCVDIQGASANQDRPGLAILDGGLSRAE